VSKTSQAAIEAMNAVMERYDLRELRQVHFDIINAVIAAVERDALERAAKIAEDLQTGLNGKQRMACVAIAQTIKRMVQE
jgi:ribosome modulation factor